MSEIKLTVVGHSYVRRLMEYRQRRVQHPEKLELGGKKFNLSYVHKGGVDYHFYNRSQRYKNKIIATSPQIIIVILGGNRVCSTQPVPEISIQMRQFHAWLKSTFPQTFIITAEVEPRFSFNPLLPPNHREESFKARRSAFNQAVKRNRDKHLMLRLADLLCDRDYFTWNGVHLEDLGNKVYWSALKGCLKEAIPKLSL